MPEILWGIESYPTASALFASDLIVRVSASETEFSREPTDMTLKNATALKGQIEASTVVDVSDAIPQWPAGFKNYVLFFKTAETGLVPTNNIYYALGLNETLVSNETFSSFESFCDFLATQLAVEQSAENAALEARLVFTVSQPLLERAWEKIRTNKSKDPYVALAVASIGIRVDGAKALEGLPKLPLEPQGQIIGSSKYFTNETKNLIAAWMDRSATIENKNQLLKFALFQGDDQLLSGALGGIAQVSGKGELAVVTEVFKRPNVSWEVKYHCIRCLGHILNEPNLVPTVDVFQKDQGKYMTSWQSELAKRGL